MGRPEELEDDEEECQGVTGYYSRGGRGHFLLVELYAPANFNLAEVEFVALAWWAGGLLEEADRQLDRF